MIKNRFSVYFVFIAILSFLVIFASITQKSYFNLINPIKEAESNSLLTPINPNLDLEIITEIEARPENLDNNGLNFSIGSPSAFPTSNQQL